MKDLAKAAGVSVMTVSRAFKTDQSVHAETRMRVLKAAEALGYVFDARAANLRTQSTKFVAVIIPSINNANFADTVGALSDRLGVAGLQVLLGHSNYQVAQEETLIEQLLRRRPDAIVLTGGRHSARARKLLENARIPVVETWDLPTDPIGHVVGFSDAEAMQGMVDYLVAQGKTRIAFLGGESDKDGRGVDRRRGFIEAMLRHGLAVHRLVAAGPPPISMCEGATAMRVLLETFPDTEVAICVSDISAFGALTECQRRGIQVPKQMGIAGFGAYEISAISHPTLTTIDPQPREIGRATADLIVRLLGQTGDRAPAAERITIGWRLCPGQSA